jgi:hypothetical protein
VSVSDPAPVWNALEVTGTGTYYSRPSSPSALGTIAYAISKTGDAVGVVKWQVSNLPDNAYRMAVNAAAGATLEEKELANTTGWHDAALEPTDTIAVTDTDPFSQPIMLSGVAFRRNRLAYTNTSGTGNLTAYVTTA